MTHTALVVEVPEVEFLVEDLREKFDGVSQLGMPAHITILYPFIETTRISDSDMDRIGKSVGEIKRFEFQLNEIGEFPETVYLSPDPGSQFIRLTERIVREFPKYPPFGGAHDSVIPHLSVLNGKKEHVAEVRMVLEQRMKKCGVLKSSCREIMLYGFESQRWERFSAFQLS